MSTENSSEFTFSKAIMNCDHCITGINFRTAKDRCIYKDKNRCMNQNRKRKEQTSKIITYTGLQFIT